MKDWSVSSSRHETLSKIASRAEVAKSRRMSADTYPPSPKDELDGLPYFPRLCEKIRLYEKGTLHADLHNNLGRGMDLWTCQFLRVSYDDLKAKVLAGASDKEALQFAHLKGEARSEEELGWFRAFLLKLGFRDDFSETLQKRIAESGFEDRDDILTMCDYIDADEGRM
jgi:gluconokinase